MNSSPIYHLVILIEEQQSSLSELVKYSSPTLPHPFTFTTETQRTTFNTSPSVVDWPAIGNRRFELVTVEHYMLGDHLSTSKMQEAEIDCTSDFIKFSSGNPMVETTHGIVHIFKYKKEAGPSDHLVTSTMLCIYSVPSHVTVKDLLCFIAPMRETIQELKVVKYGVPNRYMALLKFRSQEETDQFYFTYNNTCYRSLESEVCQLMYVSHVETTHPSAGKAFPVKDLLELPSCPVCLERLDEPVQGILTTILCNHTFHDQCISRVEEMTCPVCRYVQSPELMDDSQCADCCIRENLWMCLICGHIGCGRYGHKHAQRHFEATGHTFALELGKNLVWDYAGDAYVHRLAVNHEDGKVVQVGSGSETGDKKLDSISMEFSDVLISQLESQRAYFEAQLEQVTLESAKRIEIAEGKIEDIMTELKETKEKLSEVVKENATCSRKLQNATNLARRLQKDLEEERAMNKSLLSNEMTWRSRAEKAEADAKAAQEECRELLLNLEFRSKLEEIATSEKMTNDEMQQSEISIQPQQPSSSRRRKKR
ncbi:unnamed protein product [Calicophoron daubneyi]|uniref:BRCA1-associated protein n=1 Tax=Calicophoron daubneyi TaxID=300641 RepID=A0AAV2TJN0_CALDB